MTKVTEGSIWRGGDQQFRVLNVVEVGEHTWVHYILVGCEPNIEGCREYSCYLESFVERFSPTVL